MHTHVHIYTHTYIHTGKCHPVTCNDGSALSLTFALDGGGWLTPRPGRFTPGNDPVSIVQEAGWVPRAGLNGCGKSRHQRDSIPEPSTQRVGSRYTDYTTPPPPHTHTLCVLVEEKCSCSKNLASDGCHSVVIISVQCTIITIDRQIMYCQFSSVSTRSDRSTYRSHPDSSK